MGGRLTKGKLGNLESRKQKLEKAVETTDYADDTDKHRDGRNIDGTKIGKRFIGTFLS